MRALSRAIDRFCLKHPGFGIPMLMRYIVIISAIVFVLNLMDQHGTLFNFMVFKPFNILRGEVWRLIIWVFIPLSGNPLFTAIALYFYYFVGTTLEREWGTPKFSVYYLLGIILNIIYGFVSIFLFGRLFILSTIYLNLSLFFAFAVLFPEHTVRLFFVIPIKVKWLGLVNAGFFILSIFTELIAGNFGSAFLPLIAILNFLIICGDDLLTYLRPLRARGQSQFTNYKKSAKKTKRDIDSQPYRHKCAVCGKTDVEYPDLEFRYCSRCEGYHCFCIDHINNHVHFLE